MTKQVFDVLILWLWYAFVLSLKKKFFTWFIVQLKFIDHLGLCQNPIFLRHKGFDFLFINKVGFEEINLRIHC
jgi:hypothetical protein